MAGFKITVSDCSAAWPAAAHQCVMTRQFMPGAPAGLAAHQCQPATPVAHQCVNGTLISAFSTSEAALAALRSDLGALAPLADA